MKRRTKMENGDKLISLDSRFPNESEIVAIYWHSITFSLESNYRMILLNKSGFEIMYRKS